MTANKSDQMPVDDAILNHFKALRIIIPDKKAVLMALSESSESKQSRVHTIFSGDPVAVAAMAAQILIQTGFQAAPKDQDPVDLIMDILNNVMAQIQKNGGARPRPVKD